MNLTPPIRSRRPTRRFSRRRPLLRRVILRVRRFRPAAKMALALGAMTLFFVGCLSLSESSLWRGREEEKPLVEPVAVDRLVRVRLLGRKARPSEKLAIASPFTIEDARTGKRLGDEPSASTPGVIRPAAGVGIQWGDRLIPANDVMILPRRDAAVVIGDRTYRGTLRVTRDPDGLRFTNHVDLESYLRGVLRGELPRTFHAESFKAQCVAARTYALYCKRYKKAGTDFDVYDDEGSQVYKGVAMEDSAADRAVFATTGEVCVCDHEGREDIFCTYYSSCCGGASQHVNNVKPRDPAVLPLAGGVICNDCADAPRYRWEPVRLTSAEITRRLAARYPVIAKIGTVTDLRPRKRTPCGRIISLNIVGSGGQSEILLGEDFRLSMGGHVLKSTNFEIDAEKNAFVFKNGKGFGHGMGLCQYGMDAKARRGMNYRDILAAYYPASRVRKIYE